LAADNYTPAYGAQEDAVVYFGRLSPEKGLFTLLQAARNLPAQVKIIGDGPLRQVLEERVAQEGLANVDFLGYRSGQDLQEAIRSAAAVVLPSEWYENNPRTVIEAFALGKPVIGSRIGGIPELVRDGETGFTFEPGNAEDLREKIVLLARSPRLAEEMGRRAREIVEEELSPERHYEGLMQIYRRAAEKKGMRLG